MQDFRKLRVWQSAQLLAAEIHSLVTSLPGCNRHRIGGQLIRAALSVPANIAEGARRSSDRDFARCLRIAMGSLAETESLLDFAIKAGWVPTRDHDHLIGLITATRRRLIRLIQRLV